jgi:hypothetical protein
MVVIITKLPDLISQAKEIINFEKSVWWLA